MYGEIAKGILLPLLGTTLGAACVFFMKKKLNDSIQRALTGFAAGVMVAAAIWSLLIPSIEQSSHMGNSKITTNIYPVLSVSQYIPGTPSSATHLFKFE